MTGSFDVLLDDAMKRCSRCGLCLAVCPVYGETRQEPDSPRGQLLLIQAWREERLPAEAIAPYLAHCVLCGRCARVCPAQIPLKKIFFGARHLLRLPISWRQLAASLPPKILDFLQPPMALAQRLLPPGLKGVSLAGAPYSPPAEQSGDVLFFPGCIARRFYPRLVECCLEALGQCGHEGFIMPSLPCCGRPLAVRGQNITPLVRRWLKLLQSHPWQYLVTSCPGCLDTFTNLWPSLPGLSVAERQQAAAIADRCKNIMTLLPDVKGWHGDARIYWHKPCLETETADADARRMLADYEIRSPQSPHCCGAALHCLPAPRKAQGTEPKFSRSRTLEQWRRQKETPLAQALPLCIYHDALAQKAQMIATTCPGCKLILNGIKKAGGRTVPVLHPLEILLERPQARRSDQ